MSGDQATDVELMAHSITMAGVTSDEEHDLLNRTCKPARLQLSASKTFDQRKRVVDLPLAAAHCVESLPFATTAM